MLVRTIRAITNRPYKPYTAAGTTVTKDVPDGALSVERGELRFVEDYGSRKLRARIEKNSK